MAQLQYPTLCEDPALERGRKREEEDDQQPGAGTVVMEALLEDLKEQFRDHHRKENVVSMWLLSVSTNLRANNHRKHS